MTFVVRIVAWLTALGGGLGLFYGVLSFPTVLGRLTLVTITVAVALVLLGFFGLASELAMVASRALRWTFRNRDLERSYPMVETGGLGERLGLASTAEPPIARAAILSDSMVAIEEQRLPLTGDIGGFRGIVLALRLRNVSQQTLGLRCRLVDLRRLLPNGQWEPEDWFRSRWLVWAGNGTEERLVPGAERDCEVARQIRAWASANGEGLELGQTLLPGKWRADIEVESEGFAVRHLAHCFEWRAPSPLSPGSAFHWLRDCPPEA